MKRNALILLAALLVAPALAQTAHRAKGVVVQVDSARGSVIISQEPVAGLDWPAMTVAYTVKDKAVLDKLRKDRKIDYEFAKQGKDYVVTSVK